MNLTDEQLKLIASNGSQKVAESFSKFTKKKVSIDSFDFKKSQFKDVLSLINPPTEEGVIVYAQLISGVPGVALLITEREKALALVDLLNEVEIGTTGILKDIDRSAIKETLNILSNSYLASFTEHSDVKIHYKVPVLISPKRMKDIVTQLLASSNGDQESSIIFNTSLMITDHKIDVNLYFVFNEKLADLISK